MLTLQSITVALTLLMLAEIRTLAAPAPVQVIYTGDEGCACPTKLGYQLNVPNPPKPKKYEGGDYGYRVEKPVQTKAKISYSFDFTVEQPRTPVPPKNKPSKLYAKVDRVAVHKSDCRAAQKSSCSCSSCSADKPRYVTPQINSSTKASTNAIRRRRDLSSHGSLLRKRLMRQQQLQSRPARYVKYYHKDLDMSPEQQHKMRLFGLLPAAAPEIAAKRKTKKATVLSAKHSKRWPGFGTRRKRDIKGEYDLLEQERAKMDLTAPEIIQFMPETLNPNFKRGQCHTGGGCCGAITASAPPPPETTETEARIRVSSTEQPNNEESEAEQAETDVEQPSLVNSIPAKRSALSYYPEHQIPSPLAGSYNEYKFVDDSQLRSLLSTTSVPDPLEQSSTPLQFAGDLEAIHRRGIGSGYPVEHVADTQLDSIISGIVYQHPDYANPQSHYGGSLVDPEPVQKKQTTDFLKKLIDGRLGGWGFDTSTEPESAVRADYSTTPSKTYGFNTHSHNGYNVESYNVPPITDYLRAWF
ncbi:uncharacterized protein LOC117578018 [Drosophila albomicans]|uniref:Uncharacterized protein LOC117578018 n=1 Tax=Drosophila albomicans TaxID=7291 RepID=A0A6P8Y6A7_DROAB|nr:uncharacterized protein LOC117578018 [Drosophila albomicans]